MHSVMHVDSVNNTMASATSLELCVTCIFTTGDAAMITSLMWPCSDDEHEVQFCYGSEAGSHDVSERTLRPMLHRVLEGHNAAVVVFGSTGELK